MAKRNCLGARNNEETFAPVARYSSIQRLLASAIQTNMITHQMVLVTAFLNGKLEEDIYMQKPTSYVQLGKKNMVCKLKNL